MFKKEIRIIAWDDYAFGFSEKRVQLIGVVFRGGSFMDGLLSTAVTKDGTDASEKIISSIVSSRHYDQLSLIMLNGISFAGLNIADIKLINRKTKLPVIAVIRRQPDIEKFIKTMEKFPDYMERAAAVRSAGEVYKYRDIFYQAAGATTQECEQIFKITCTQSNIPEPLRCAHLIASGLSRPLNHAEPDKNTGFESRGRA